MNTKLMILIVSSSLTACSQADTPKAQAQQVPQQHVQKVAELLTQMQVTHVKAAKALETIRARPDVTVIDVRTPREFATGHIEGAININFKNANFATEISKLDKSQNYLIHCRSGGRSVVALKSFKAQGFSHIIHMDGGIQGWKKAGLPTVK